jgi:hypothetical protein
MSCKKGNGLSKGSYLGGHTIITVPYTGKFKKNKETKSQILKRVQKQTVNTVIDVELNGLVMTKIPRSVVKHLGKSIETKGGIHEWAHAQESYTSMKARKLRKKQKRLLNSDN